MLLHHDLKEALEADPFSFKDHWNIELLIKINKEREALIRNKLIEKGFDHLIEGMDKRRFPKVCFVKQGQWTYCFADNDTDEGAFIVAFQDLVYSSVMEKDFTFSFKAGFNIKETYNKEVNITL